MFLLSLEGPYISLFRLLRESSPSLLHPSLLFFVFSPLDPANPPTHPLSVYTAARGGSGLQCLRVFLLAKHLIVPGARSQFLTMMFTPPKKNPKAVLVSLLLISSSISVTHPSGIFSSWLGHFLIPSSCIEGPSFPLKNPIHPLSLQSSSSYPEFTFFISLQHFNSIPPSSRLPAGLLFKTSTQLLPHSLALFHHSFLDTLNPFLFLFSSTLCLQ